MAASEYVRPRSATASSRRDEAIERAKGAWADHHGSSIGIVRAPERTNEVRNREILEAFIKGTSEGR